MVSVLQNWTSKLNIHSRHFKNNTIQSIILEEFTTKFWISPIPKIQPISTFNVRPGTDSSTSSSYCRICNSAQFLPSFPYTATHHSLTYCHHHKPPSQHTPHWNCSTTINSHPIAAVPPHTQPSTLQQQHISLQHQYHHSYTLKLQLPSLPTTSSCHHNLQLQLPAHNNSRATATQLHSITILHWTATLPDHQTSSPNLQCRQPSLPATPALILYHTP